MKHTFTAVVLIFVTSSANAYNVIFDASGNFITAIENINVDGGLYNVDFDSGANFPTFGGTTDFWNTQAEAIAASDAVNTVLNAVDPDLFFDGLVVVNTGFPGIYHVNYNGGTSAVANSTLAAPGWYSQSLAVPAEPLLATAWTAVVPIPAAVWLFASALAGLGWLHRRSA